MLADGRHGGGAALFACMCFQALEVGSIGVRSGSLTAAAGRAGGGGAGGEGGTWRRPTAIRCELGLRRGW